MTWLVRFFRLDILIGNPLNGAFLLWKLLKWSELFCIHSPLRKAEGYFQGTLYIWLCWPQNFMHDASAVCTKVRNGGSKVFQGLGWNGFRLALTPCCCVVFRASRGWVISGDCLAHSPNRSQFPASHRASHLGSILSENWSVYLPLFLTKWNYSYVCLHSCKQLGATKRMWTGKCLIRYRWKKLGLWSYPCFVAQGPVQDTRARDYKHALGYRTNLIPKGKVLKWSLEFASGPAAERMKNWKIKRAGLDEQRKEELESRDELRYR